jgi:hypothetical protein
MGSHRHPGIFARLSAKFLRKPAPLDEYGRARALIAAIDRGGVPLNGARINTIARDLGLDVSPRAQLDETIQRIRDALARAPDYE